MKLIDKKDRLSGLYLIYVVAALLIVPFSSQAIEPAALKATDPPAAPTFQTSPSDGSTAASLRTVVITADQLIKAVNGDLLANEVTEGAVDINSLISIVDAANVSQHGGFGLRYEILRKFAAST